MLKFFLESGEFAIFEASYEHGEGEMLSIDPIPSYLRSVYDSIEEVKIAASKAFCVPQTGFEVDHLEALIVGDFLVDEDRNLVDPASLLYRKWTAGTVKLYTLNIQLGFKVMLSIERPYTAQMLSL